MYITFNGHSDKSVIIKTVYKRWGVDTDDDNIADSVGLARIAYHHFTGDIAGISKKEIEAVKKARIEHTPKGTSRRKKRLTN